MKEDNSDNAELQKTITTLQTELKNQQIANANTAKTYAFDEIRQLEKEEEKMQKEADAYARAFLKGEAEGADEGDGNNTEDAVQNDKEEV